MRQQWRAVFTLTGKNATVFATLKQPDPTICDVMASPFCTHYTVHYVTLCAFQEFITLRRYRWIAPFC